MKLPVSHRSHVLLFLSLCLFLAAVSLSVTLVSCVKDDSETSLPSGEEQTTSRVTHVLVCDEAETTCELFLGRVHIQGDVAGTPGDLTLQVSQLTDGDAIFKADTGAGTWTSSFDNGTTVVEMPNLSTIQTNFLAKDNITAYTPTLDYHPATKVYVDGLAPSGTGAAPEYSLSGTGAAELASGSFTNSGWFQDPAMFTAYAVVKSHALNTAGSYLKVTQSALPALKFDFGQTATNRLYVSVGTNTYTSSSVYFSSANYKLPLSVAVMIDSVGGEAIFCARGQCEAAIAITPAWPAVGDELVELGSGFDGEIFALGVAEGEELFAASSYYTPFTEGLHLAWWDMHYDMDNGSGATVTERYYESLGLGTQRDLAVTSGTWVEYVGGY